MSVEHVIFIPGVLLVGIVLGYLMGLRTVRTEIRRMRERMRE